MKATLLRLALLAPLGAHASGASLPGPTGLLTVPTAAVRSEGTAGFAFNAHDSVAGYDESKNYLFGLGLLPGFEIDGRIAQPGDFEEGSDLSFNAKLQLWSFDAGPSLAVGATDIGGEAPNFRSRYAVVTLPWRALSLTVGHRWGPDLHEGTLAGLEWRPWSVLGLYAEYDTEATNPGVRLQSPELWHGLKVAANVGYRGDPRETEAGIEFSLPLGKVKRPAPARTEFPAGPVATGRAAASALRLALEDLGFEAVRTGSRPDGTLVVALENRRYNHSTADGIGLALGTIATRAAAEVERIELNLSAYGVPQVAASASAQGWRDFLRDGTADPALLDVRHIDGRDRQVGWHNEAQHLGASELYVEPVLRTFVATEYGVLDAGVGLRARFLMPLAPGVTAQVGAQAPVAKTDDFRSGENFGDFAPEAGLDLLIGQYAHKVSPGWTSLWNVGLVQVFQTDLSLFGTEQAWISPQGAHRLNAKLMTLGSDTIRHNVLLGGYAWYDAARRYSLSLTGGRYYLDDTGVRIELNRYFDDTIAGLFLKVEGRENMAGGFQISIPLTPRRDAMPHGIQVKGPRRWGHALQSTLNLADGSNSLKPLLLYEPLVDLDLRRDFLDSGRLGADYLRNELPRMREAWQLWGG